MVDLVSISNRKHSENLESEALQASDRSTVFENVDRILGISSLKNMVKQGEFDKAMLTLATSPEAANFIDGTSHKADIIYQSSNLESYEQMMQYHIQRSEEILKKIKDHPKAEMLFEKVDELCNEHSAANIVELMSKNFDNPEVNKTISDVNSLINSDPQLKNEFQEFQSEYSQFTNAQSMYKKELVDQLQNDQLVYSEREALLQHADDRVNIINSNFNDVLEQGKNVPVYNQSNEHESPMISDQHQQLMNVSKSEFDGLRTNIADMNVQNKNQNQLSM